VGLNISVTRKKAISFWKALLHFRRKQLKSNIFGIIGGIIAFVSLFFPWWMMIISSSSGTERLSFSIFPYEVTRTLLIGSSGIPQVTNVNIWYGWIALVLIVIGGLISIAGSIKERTRAPIAAGGLLMLLSIIIFAIGLQNELSSQPSSLWPANKLFSSGTWSILFTNFPFSAYLTYGFWLALTAAIITLFAALWKPEIATPTQLAPQPSPTVSQTESNAPPQN
jgi:hypothetical protein